MFDKSTFIQHVENSSLIQEQRSSFGGRVFDRNPYNRAPKRFPGSGFPRSSLAVPELERRYGIGDVLGVDPEDNVIDRTNMLHPRYDPELEDHIYYRDARLHGRSWRAEKEIEDKNASRKKQGLPPLNKTTMDRIRRADANRYAARIRG